MDEPSFRDTPQCLIYDGRCRMCVTAKGGLEQLRVENKALRMIPYQSEEAERLLGPHYRRGRPEAAFLIAADGRIASGLDAFLPLLPGLKGGRVLARLFALPLVKPLGYWIYRLVAKYRYEVFGEVPLDRQD
jgi:predicted DCC family thiol-disulfide oxidoreductase YuxK